MKLTDLKPGDLIVADDGFTCLTEGEVCEVLFSNDANEAYVKCSDGTHYLDGQLDEDGEIIVGFTRCEFTINQQVMVKADSDYPAQSGTIVLIDDGIHIDLNDGQEPIKCRPDELEKV
jgi:hypothetical protein